MKLLVNAPNGVQEIIDVGDGGGYFDESLVLWDERRDGLMPGIVVGGMVKNEQGALEFSEERMLETTKAITKMNVPIGVSMRQARLALLSIGKLNDVAAAIESLPSPQKEAAQIEWDYSSAVERHRPLVQALGPLLQLSEDDLDNLFILAATL